MSFKNYVEIRDFVESYGSAIMPGGIDHVAAHSQMGIPLVKKSGRIDVLITKKNPIYVQLSDGTKLFFSPDEYRRIRGKPGLGKTMTATFQRRTNDGSKQPSQIISCEVN